MIGFLKLVPWPVWVGLGISVIAIIGTWGGVMYNRGINTQAAKTERALVQWERAQDTTNREVDADTNKADGELIKELGRIERKWSVSPPQSPQQP